MRNSQSAEGLRSMCRDVRTHLSDLCHVNDSFWEIGSYAGESTEIFLQEFPFMKVTSIDPWKGGYDDDDTASQADFQEVYMDFLNRTQWWFNHEYMRNTFENFFKLMKQNDQHQVLMVYIDASHRYEDVKKDIEMSLECIIPGGIISGHDFLIKPNEKSHVNGVQKAVREILGEPDEVYADTSWIKLL